MNGLGIERLGQPLDVEPIKMQIGPRSRPRVTLTVREYEEGWSIVAEETRNQSRYHGRFTAVIWRCLFADPEAKARAGYGENDVCTGPGCLGHRQNVQVLAKKVLRTYREGLT